MTIEFHCVSCRALLRVKDESAGKQAKCPACAIEQQIPLAAVPPAGDGAPVRTPPPSLFSQLPAETSWQPAISDNPYQSPAADDTQWAHHEASGDTIVNPTTLDFSTVVNQSWAIYKSRMGLAIGGYWLAWVLTQIVSFGATHYGRLMMDNLPKNGMFYFFVMHIASTLFGLFLGLGVVKLTINMAGGRQARIADLFGCGPQLVSVTVAWVIYVLICLVGFVLLIIPGIVVSFMFSQFAYLIVDKNLSAMDALLVSKKVTEGNKLTLLRLGIISIGLPILGVLVCGVGVIVAIPYVYMLWAVAYLTMTGQPIVRP